MEDSDQQSTESGASIGSNDDLLTEILLRLPATSIFRFKSVSKHWRWLLSHRYFTLRYDSLSKSPSLCASEAYAPFDVENRSTPPFRSLDFYFNSRDISIKQSCNGLLLCCTWDGPVPKYYVFNPTTKQLAVIPFLPGGRKAQKNILFMGLAFHQTDCVHYKLVCIRRLVSKKDFIQIQLYSSETRKWKISIESFTVNDARFRLGVYWNGAMHWCQSFGTPLYFKMDTEQLLTFPLPVGLTSFEIMRMHIVDSRGHLHLIVTRDQGKNSFCVNVYEMLSDHSGCFFKYQVVVDQILSAFRQMIYMSRPPVKVIDLVRGEREEDTFMVLTIDFNLIKVNVHDKSFKKIFTRSSLGLSFHRYTEAISSF